MMKKTAKIISIVAALTLSAESAFSSAATALLRRSQDSSQADFASSALADSALYFRDSRGLAAYASRKTVRELWPTVTSFAVATAVIAHAFQPSSLSHSLIFLSSLLFPGLPSSKFLGATETHLLEAADHLGITMQEVQTLVDPARAVNIHFQFRLDHGNYQRASAIRYVMAFPGKGGIRSATDVDQATIISLHLDMDVKPPRTITIHGVPLRGAKGGSDIDLNGLTTGEKVRWMRGWVAAVMDHVWQTEGRVAFGPLFDTPAPDVGTSQPDVNLMDYFADEMNRWLLRHLDEVSPWLAQNDYRLAADLQMLGQSNRRTPIRFNKTGPQLELPFVERIIHLRETQQLTSLRLLAGVTGKTAPNEDLPYGRGGIRGRAQATGMGLALATLEMMKLHGDLPSDSKTLENKTVAIQGFGNVGQGAALSYQFLRALVRAIAEHDGPSHQSFALLAPGFFTSEAIQDMKNYRNAHHGSVLGYENTPVAKGLGLRKISMPEFWSLNVDVMAPAATENVIDKKVANLLVAPYVAEGANGPTTTDADKILHRKHIVAIPDVVANSGGVLVSWMEMLQDIGEEGQPWTEEQVFEELRGLINQRLIELDSHSQDRGISLREAVHELWLNTRLPGVGRPVDGASLLKSAA